MVFVVTQMGELIGGEHDLGEEGEIYESGEGCITACEKGGGRMHDISCDGEGEL